MNLAAFYAKGHKCMERDFGKAVALYEAVGSVRAYRNMAWIYATAEDSGFRDGRKAVAHAAQSFASGPSDKVWSQYAAQAAAYARNGQFPEAIENEEIAIENVGTVSSYPDSSKKEIRAACEQRLALYKSGKAYVGSGYLLGY